jgi:hypothetical protein
MKGICYIYTKSLQSDEIRSSGHVLLGPLIVTSRKRN